MNNIIKKSINGRNIQIKVPYKRNFSILKANKVYFPQLKDDKKTKYIEQQLFLNIPQFMMSDDEFLQVIALKANNKIVISSEEMNHIQTKIEIVNEYQLLKFLESLKQQKLGIMNVDRYEEIIEKVNKNINNQLYNEFMIDNDNVLDEQIIVTRIENNETFVESIKIKYIFPGEYILETKKILFNEYDLKHIQKTKQKTIR